MRRTALLACAVMLAFACLGGTAFGASLTIDNPVDGTSYQSPPATYSGTGGVPVLSGYGYAVDLFVFQDDINGPLVRAKFLNDLDVNGDYSVNASDLLTNPPPGTGEPLPDGRYVVKVYQAPLLGQDPLVTTSAFWVDSHDPDTSIDSALPPSPTNATSRDFTFSGTDPAPTRGLGHFECSIDGGAYSTCTSPFNTGTLAEGNHTFSVKAIDLAGNEDPTPATSSWMIDTTPPTATITTPPNRQHYLLDENVPADYSCDDPPSGGPPPVASGIASCVGTVPNGSPIDTETLGPHLFTVTPTDNAGNVGTPVTHAYVVDPPRYADFLQQDHPLAYYRLNEPLGSGPMLDSSGNHHDGEYKNGIALQRPAAIACERRPHPPRACETANDPQDWAAFFPARDGYGYVNGITAPTTAYSLEAWIKPANGDDMSIVGHGGGGQLFISGGHLALRQTQDTVVGGGPTLTPGQWWHVAASWDGHNTRLYVNGAQVGFSNSANKPPSGTSTFYVGYGDQAPWFHGTLDEVAYYDHAVPADSFADHYEIGTAFDHPSLGYPPDGSLDTAGPKTDPDSPVNGGLYAPGKVPNAQFDCDDPDGPGDIASCTATVDGNPVNSGDPLPDSLGPHTFTVTAVDKGTPPLTYVHTHTYTVKPFADIYKTDNPVAYYRLGDGDGTMADSSGNHHDGEYKNNQQSGPVGIAGDGDHARRFFGDGGYGYVNGIAAPRYQSTLEVWVNATSGRDQNILGHGDAGALFVRGGKFVYRRMGDELVGSAGPTPGTWQQVAGVWDGQTMFLYVNGVEVGRMESTKRPSSVSTFYVGYGEFGPWFDGSLDEVAYYDIALTPARVYQHFLADPPPADLSTPSGGGTTSTPAPSSGGESSSPASGSGGGSASNAPASSPSNTTATSPAAAPKTATTATPKTLSAKARALAKCQKLKGSKRKACQRKVKRAYAKR